MQLNLDARAQEGHFVRHLEPELKCIGEKP